MRVVGGTPVVTIPTVSSHIVDLVTQHGLVAVFLLMALESCGIPIPSELVMPVAGALAAGALGGVHLNAVAATFAGAGGNLAGSVAAWLIAAWLGERFLLGPGRWVGIRQSHVELADRLFQRRGLLLVFLGRMVPVVRTYVSFPAGLARVPLGRFSALTFLGALPWCAALTFAGYQVGANYDRVNGPVSKVAFGVALVVVAVVAVWFVRGRKRAAEQRPAS